MKKIVLLGYLLFLLTSCWDKQIEDGVDISFVDTGAISYTWATVKEWNISPKNEEYTLKFPKNFSIFTQASPLPVELLFTDSQNNSGIFIIHEKRMKDTAFSAEKYVEWNMGHLKYKFSNIFAIPEKIHFINPYNYQVVDRKFTSKIWETSVKMYARLVVTQNDLYQIVVVSDAQKLPLNKHILIGILESFQLKKK